MIKFCLWVLLFTVATTATLNFTGILPYPDVAFKYMNMTSFLILIVWLRVEELHDKVNV